MTRICYVSAFLNIGRDEWVNFTRSFEDYLDSFLPYIELFKKHHDKNVNGEKWCMVLFIDARHYDCVCEKIDEVYDQMPITIVPIDDDFLNQNSPLWTRLNREREIMESVEYKTKFAHRLRFPENSNPKYTLINHAKVDFLAYALNHIDTVSEFFCWTDFGYFKNKNLMPESLLCLNKLDIYRVNYTLVNPITQNDSDIMYTMNNAPEVIGGFFFFGNRDVLLKYQKLYHEMHLRLQNLNLADDDQHIALRCVFEQPDLFCLHLLGRWHMAHLHFQC